MTKYIKTLYSSIAKDPKQDSIKIWGKDPSRHFSEKVQEGLQVHEKVLNNIR